MLHMVTSSYHDLARLVPGILGRLPSSVRKKQILLEMAGRGVPKSSLKGPLRKDLRYFTCKSSGRYDPEFTKRIGELNPDWLAPQIVLNKRLLLDMAGRGEPKPNHKTHLGQVFRTYTQKSSKIYDPKFTKRIRELRPDWLATLDESTNSKKRILIDMAAKGGAKPSLKTSMGKFLYVCTLKSSIYFDPEFTNEIKKRAPDWLTPSRSERTSQTKRLLLDMASKGEPKPSSKTSLHKALYRFTRKSCGSYDPIFTRNIKKLAPHWFEKAS
jgi:hypothetical protein